MTCQPSADSSSFQKDFPSPGLDSALLAERLRVKRLEERREREQADMTGHIA